MDGERTLCTTCGGAAQIAEQLVTVLGHLVTSAPSRIRLLQSAWDDLEHKDRQVLVMTCRAVAEQISETLLESMVDEAVSAGVELNIIATFLATKAAHELRDDEPVSGMVIRLLEPHLGNRIVLPDGVRV